MSRIEIVKLNKFSKGFAHIPVNKMHSKGKCTEARQEEVSTSYCPSYTSIKSSAFGLLLETYKKTYLFKELKNLGRFSEIITHAHAK